jgi:hypothetical protein
VDGTLIAADVNLNGGSLNGTGTIQGNVTNAATVSPGDAPGTLAVQGSFTQTSAGVLDIDLGGTNHFGKLAISGSATLDGTLNVSLVNGFAPSLGDSFKLLSFGSPSGDFATRTGLDLGNGMFLTPVYDSGGLTLYVTNGHQSASTVTLTSSTSNPAFGQQITLTAMIHPAVPGNGSPGGTVQFQLNGVNLGEPVIVSGQAGEGRAVLNAVMLPLGRFTLSAVYGGDGNFTGSSGKLNIVSGTDNERWLNQVYLDLLHRAVEPFGLTAWSAVLRRPGFTRSQVVQAIEVSPEYAKDLVESYYGTYLQRSPDQPGLNAWAALLEAGAPRERVQAGIIGSEEYFQKRGGTAAGFLSALYQDALARPIDPTGRVAFSAALAHGASPGAVAAALFASEEYRRDLIGADYRGFLHRLPDTFGLISFLEDLNVAVSGEQILAAILGSPEYFSHV